MSTIVYKGASPALGRDFREVNAVEAFGGVLWTLSLHETRLWRPHYLWLELATLWRIRCREEVEDDHRQLFQHTVVFRCLKVSQNLNRFFLRLEEKSKITAETMR